MSPPGSKAKQTNKVCNQRFSADPKYPFKAFFISYRFLSLLSLSYPESIFLSIFLSEFCPRTKFRQTIHADKQIELLIFRYGKTDEKTDDSRAKRQLDCHSI